MFNINLKILIKNEVIINIANIKLMCVVIQSYCMVTQSKPLFVGQNENFSHFDRQNHLILSGKIMSLSDITEPFFLTKWHSISHFVRQNHLILITIILLVMHGKLMLKAPAKMRDCTSVVRISTWISTYITGITIIFFWLLSRHIPITSFNLFYAFT